MQPDPSTAARERDDRIRWSYNARAGLVLFFVYLALYAGFIALSAFDREAMARPSLGGVNFAIVYGFGLIVAAFVLALVYMVICKAEPVEPASDRADVADLTEGRIVEAFDSEGGP